MKYCYILIACFLMTSCLQEELEPSEYVFRGTWDSPKYAIQIFMNGSATLDIRRRGSLNGFVKIKGNDMVFISDTEGDEISRKKFHIDQWPTTDSDGTTYMILDGHVMVKQ